MAGGSRFPIPTARRWTSAALACIQNAEDEENRLALAELMERALADFVPSSKPN
jgi:hypothetical protein